MLARHAPGLAWLPVAMRKHFTPAALGSAITAIAISIGYVLNAQRDIHQLKDSVAEQGKQLDVLHRIDTELAVMNNSMNGMTAEVDRLREWRERIEDVADTAPHARRRKP
jgi:hypothetical protein